MLLCRFVEWSRSTYYRWTNPKLSQRYLHDTYLANEIGNIYQTSRGTYESPRVWSQLRRQGVRVGTKRVARIMAERDLIGAHSRRQWR